MRYLKSNRKGMALPMVFVFLVISQLVYMGLLHLNQLNMQHYRLFQHHYAASIQLLLARSQLAYSPEALAEQWENEWQAVLAEQFAERMGAISFTWLTEESFQAGALQLGESEVLVFEQSLEVLEGAYATPTFETSDAIRQQMEALGYELVETSHEEDKRQWQVPLSPDAHFKFNTGEVQCRTHQLLSEVFHSQVQLKDSLTYPQCEYLVKWRAFFYREE